MTSNALKRVAAGLAAAAVLLATGCQTTGADKSEPETKPAPLADARSVSSASPSASTAVEDASPTPSPTPEPLPSVPKISGMDHADAEQALIAAGFVVGEITEIPSARPAGTILRQGIKVGTSIAAGTAVALEIAVPYPAVPSVVGRLQRAAAGMLRGAGFTVQVNEETRSSGREGVVLSQTPAGSELAAPGAVVTLVVLHVVRPVTPHVSHSCTPGYTPCLPPASDYDCAGGSGDGPEYADGPIYVTGSDPYGLDSEGDGVACE